jgi:hypothetical protein
MFTAAALADRILGLWLGEDFSRYGYWTGGLFALTALTSLVGFAGVSMMVRANALAAMNRAALTQVVVMYGVAALTIQSFSQTSFVIGQMVGSLAVMPWQLWLVSKTVKLPPRFVGRLGAIVAIAAIPAVIRVFSHDPLADAPLWALAAAASAVVLAQWAFCYWRVLDDGDRAKLRGIGGSLFSKRSS